MKEFFSLPSKKRKEIIKKIKEILQNKEEILFAYIYGSFLGDPVFRDIDVGIYLKPEHFTKEKGSYKYTFKIAGTIEEKIGRAPIVDLKVLNEAPFYFLNNIFSRGELLFNKNEEFLGDLIEDISSRYLQYRPLAEQYLRERLKS